MKIFVINSGSSSLKYKLFDMSNECCLFTGHIDGIGLPRCKVKLKYSGKEEENPTAVKDHVEALGFALNSLKDRGMIKDYSEISAVGHRVVHGGEAYHEPTLIDDHVIQVISDLSELAPLHNPPNLAGILACKKTLPNTAQVAIFDTAFHHTIPEVNYLYGLPRELYEENKIRKYGFHGTSHKYVSEQAYKILNAKKGKQSGKIITCHLGNGSSITAIKDGKSVDTSMGFTPLDGLVMGSRTGAIDPGILIYLLKHKNYTVDALYDMLNKKSGLLGISGLTSDVRDLQKANVEGNKRAALAIDILCAKIAFYIGGYAAALDGVDCIVFTGGIGEGGWFVRRDVCKQLGYLGVKIDSRANRNCQAIISAKDSKVKVYVIPTNEELEIARETKGVVGR